MFYDELLFILSHEFKSTIIMNWY